MRFRIDKVDHRGNFDGCPRNDLVPLMAWMEERMREKARRQRSQPRVLL